MGYYHKWTITVTGKAIIMESNRIDQIDGIAPLFHECISAR
jgi:hypothetical protein